MNDLLTILKSLPANNTDEPSSAKVDGKTICVTNKLLSNTPITGDNILFTKCNIVDSWIYGRSIEFRECNIDKTICSSDESKLDVCFVEFAFDKCNISKTNITSNLCVQNKAIYQRCEFDNCKITSFLEIRNTRVKVSNCDIERISLNNCEGASIQFCKIYMIVFSGNARESVLNSCITDCIDVDKADMYGFRVIGARRIKFGSIRNALFMSDAPEYGSFEAYTTVYGYSDHDDEDEEKSLYVLRVRIPEDAVRISTNLGGFMTNKLEVIDIYGMGARLCSKDVLDSTRISSCIHKCNIDNKLLEVGDTIVVDKKGWNDNPFEEGNGIICSLNRRNL